MKKIVGILAAAAVLATSVFAADVSASTKIGGKLFSYVNEYVGDDGVVPTTTSLFTETPFSFSKRMKYNPTGKASVVWFSMSRVSIC